MTTQAVRIADAAIYDNKDFYDTPKEYYSLVLREIHKRYVGKSYSLLDIGCANGSFLHHAQAALPQSFLTGAEPIAELAKIAKENTSAEILNNGLFELSNERQYQTITMLGVLGIFADPTEVLTKIRRITSKKGWVFIFSPFNEEDIDVILSYRRAPSGPWESGHNLYSMKTLDSISSSLNFKCEWVNFQMSRPIIKTADPMRSWTEPFRGNENHLIYGTNMLSTMKLLILQDIS